MKEVRSYHFSLNVKLKRIVLAACFLLTFLQANSQQFQVATNDTFAINDTSVSIIGATVDIVNLLGVNLDMAWEIDSFSAPAGWDYTVCDPITCSPANALGNFWTLEPSNGFLLLEMYPQGILGSGYMRIKVYEINDTVNLQYISLTVDATPLSIPETSVSFLVYPNPVIDFMYIKTNDRVIESSIYSSLGQLMHSASETKINVNNYPTGTYYIQTLTNHGIRQRTFVKY